MLASPILTRLYTPAEFGVLAQYTALLNTLLVIVSLRFEVTVPLADEEHESVHLVSFALLMTVVSSLLVALILFCAGPAFASRISLGGLGIYVYLLPLGLLGGGFYQTLSYWAVRQRWFPIIARTKVQQVSGGIAIQTLFGGLIRAAVISAGPLGLLLGSVANHTMGYTSFARRGKLFTRMREAHVGRSAMIGAARRHWRTALGSSVSGFINMLGLQLPLLMMASLFGLQASGCLLLSSRIVTAGGDLIGSTVGQTYYGEASARYRKDRAELKRLFVKAVRSLVVFNTLLAVVVWIVAPKALVLVFGVKWAQAGMFARYQSLVLLGVLTCSPVSTTIFILRKVYLQVIWDICRVGMVLGSFYGARHMHWTAVQAVGLYSVGSLIMYAIWIGVLTLLVFRASEAADEGIIGPTGGLASD